jgi:hypothetical protein
LPENVHGVEVVTTVPAFFTKSPPIVMAPVIVSVPEPFLVKPPADPTVPAILISFPFVSKTAFEARVNARFDGEVIVPVA